ncbi:MAG TPA: ABC transporter ATP-binding protein [Acidimicrobiales bacterium]|nr:ABC transporter ATP-binding protein [Acidimicrobiales bacterium]
MASVVELAGVRLAFGRSVALDGLDLDAPAGEVTVLLGPNGAGKTTAIRVITGALRPDAGTVRVFGLTVDGPDGEEVRRRCGVVAAKPALYDRLSGYDNLAYSAALYDAPANRIADAAARFGIEHALDLRVGGYSTGMKTRLALARAILHDPDLLLLDEPTSGLDPESADAVLALIDELAASGKAVVMCTHLLPEAEGLADRVVMIEAGRALAAGAPHELAARYWPNPRVDLRVGEGAVRVDLDDIDEVGAVVALLAGAGVEVNSVVPYRPSLAELYRRVRSER